MAFVCAASLAAIASMKPVMALDACDDALSNYNQDMLNLDNYSDAEATDEWYIGNLEAIGVGPGDPEYDYWVARYNENEAGATESFGNADAQYTWMKQNQCPYLP